MNISNQSFKTNNLIEKSLAGNYLSLDEAMFLYEHAQTSELIWAANEIRKIKIPANIATWMIDRNVNITNVCNSGCTFCNFHTSIAHPDSYITTLPEYVVKIKELQNFGGNQLLLQGGCHPKLKLQFYVDLFKNLKNIFPNLKLHALGPPEIVHLAKLEQISYEECLKQLINAGLDSLPGAGAEILSDRVRQLISKNKCNSKQWLDVMRIAHQLNLTTSATMMFGHIETLEERLNHLILLREVQDEKPITAKGFIAFIPWPVQLKDTHLSKQFNLNQSVRSDEYIRLIALSRILLNNFTNIQASWLTVGKHTAQICLHAGANDFGSIMIEENVVSKAGANHSFNAEQIQEAIQEAGFTPKQRNQQYEILN